MKNKNILKYTLLFSCLVLCGCQSGVTQYTSSDVADYNLQTTNSSKANMISVKQMNKDTIWTFQESYERGLRWQTIDHHVMDSSNETNTLENNYKTIVIDYYLSQDNEITDYFNIKYSYIDGYRFGILFQKKYDSRKTIQEACDKLQAFQNDVIENNQQYIDKELSYDFQMLLKNGNHTIYVSDALDADTADLDNFKIGLLYQDPDILKEYSNTEKNNIPDDLQKIYMRSDENEEWMPSNYYTYQGVYSIASTVVFDILQNINHENVVVEGNRDSFNIKIDDKDYGNFEDTMISFMQAEKITGIQFDLQDE